MIEQQFERFVFNQMRFFLLVHIFSTNHIIFYLCTFVAVQALKRCEGSSCTKVGKGTISYQRTGSSGSNTRTFEDVLWWLGSSWPIRPLDPSRDFILRGIRPLRLSRKASPTHFLTGELILPFRCLFFSMSFLTLLSLALTLQLRFVTPEQNHIRWLCIFRMTEQNNSKEYISPNGVLYRSDDLYKNLDHKITTNIIKYMLIFDLKNVCWYFTGHSRQLCATSRKQSKYLR